MAALPGVYGVAADSPPALTPLIETRKEDRSASMRTAENVGSPRTTRKIFSGVGRALRVWLTAWHGLYRRRLETAAPLHPLSPAGLNAATMGGVKCSHPEWVGRS